VDYVVNKAASLGLVVALLPDRNLIIDENWGAGPLNETTAFSYGRFIGHRYAAKPIVWILGWDVQPFGREAVFTSLANGIAQGAAGGDHSKILITFHSSPTSPTVGNSSSDWFHQFPWLDFNSVYSSHMDNTEAYGYPETHKLISDDYALTPVKPTVDMEPVYEGTFDGIFHGNGSNGPRIGADVMRRKAYWGIFAGAFGYTFGNIDIVTLHENGRPFINGSSIPWKTAINSSGAAHMAHFRTLLESRSQLIRIPDQSMVSSVGTGLSHIRATRASDGSYAYVYIPDGRAVTVNMAKIIGTGVNASWFDPRTGAFTSIGQFANTGTQSFDPPGATQNGNDWVLVLDSVQLR
jgi:Protein of unknown function (DUF4038)/Putative collagen-binding domain of a collagenase